MPHNYNSRTHRMNTMIGEDEMVYAIAGYDSTHKYLSFIEVDQ